MGLTSTARDGRDADFREFAASRTGHLYRSACLLTSGDTHLAEDLVQETLSQMYVVWHRTLWFPGKPRIDNPAAYAHTVLVRIFLAHRRRRSSSERPIGDLPEAPGRDPDDTLRLTLLDALGQLSPPDRAVLVDTKNWTATLTGADGRRINVMEWNSSREKGAPISRPNPPLTLDQLSAVVTARSWDAIVAAIPEPRKPVPSSRRQFPGDQILAVAAKALPSGLTEADTDGSEGYANFTVDDGKGVSMVEINVQDWSGALKRHEAGDTTQGDTIAQLFTDAQTLPDGTKVTRQRSGHRWVVDTLRPDGLRVVVAAYNSGGPQQPADRTSPALSYDQLQAIATSPGWPPFGASAR